MSIIAAMQAISRIVRRFVPNGDHSIFPLASSTWTSGFFLGASVAIKAPADARILLSELNRMTAARNDTSPELYEREQAQELDMLLEALTSGRFHAADFGDNGANLTQQASVVVEMAYVLGEANVPESYTGHDREIEISRRMGIYLAGLSLGMRLGNAHSATSAEALGTAVLDYVHKEHGGASPYLLAHLESVEQETVRRVLSGEGISA